MNCRLHLKLFIIFIMLVIKIYSGDTTFNTGHIVFSNSPKDLLSYVIYYLPIFKSYCELFVPVLVHSNDIIIENDRLYDLLNDINLFTGLSSEKIKGSLSTLNVFGKDEYFINQLKTLKQWNKKKLTMKSNKQEIVKIFDDFAKNQRISQLIFSFFCLYWDCFLSPNTVSLDAHHEFENTIFSNIRPVKSDSESIVDLNNCNEINFSIILESEYLIAVFICDFIQNIIDESEFSTMFSSENFSKNEQLALKEIYKQIESIDELEPFESEISGSLTHYLNLFKKDVHLVFAFRKLDERLFSFIEEESLNSVVSVFTKQRIRDKVFGNQEIFKVLFDLYKKYLKRSAENLKKIKCVKSINYMDLE
ncbi:hypothetical protein CWI36_0014p0060 [Hamiltosporidium magnivora]|uniref:Uncharacterized protein n=1 Tax=Hamiltosporidium magnivora TaxID=148818 RepID=A0A4V2JWY2_9MICR|nr:hypothetical protein CWI36_0014p0060 [Hamiltosporidium magnivora]